ncbi:MAG: HAD family phosphatase [Bacillota bacterium]
MKIIGAIFDMDGTLTDSMFIWQEIGKRYLLARGITPRETLWDELRDLSGSQVPAYFQETYGLKNSHQEIIEGIAAMLVPIYREEVFPKPGIFLLLDRLKARGVKMCVASATDLSIVEMVLEKTGLLPYFSAAFSCMTLGVGKDRPHIYEEALAHLGTPKAETYVFEDALYAAKTAKMAGFPVIGVFDPSAAGDAEELKALSVLYLNDYEKDYTLF